MKLYYWQVRLCVFLSARLPLRLCYALAAIAGDIAYTCCPQLREDTKSSIAHILGQAKDSPAVSSVTRKCIRNYAKSTVEFCRYSMRPGRGEASVSFEGLDRLDAALGEGKGAIIVGLHLGSWDVGATSLARRRYPLNAFVRSFEGNAKISRAIQDLRRKVGVVSILAEDGIRHAAEVLRRNELLAMLIDAPSTGRLVKVKFLQGYAQFSPGVAALALRTKAAVLPGCIVRLPDNTFKAFIGKKIECHFSGNFRRDIQHLSQGILDSMQEFVTQYPEQWGMLRKVWYD